MKKMKKLKQLLKETYAWEREFGQPLPTLKDTTKRHQEKLNEVDYTKVQVPATVKRFLNKFVDSMKGANLNRLKRSAILYQVIDASGITTQQLMADIQKIKKELQKGKEI